MKILLIEDEKIMRELAAKLLDDMFGKVANYELSVAGTAEEGMNCWIERQPHTVLQDLHLKEYSGEASIELIKTFRVRSDVVVLSGDSSLRPRCFEAGAMDFIDKLWAFTQIEDDRGRHFKFQDLVSRLTSSYYRCIYGPQRAH